MTSSNGNIFTGLCAGNSPGTGALMFSLICVWINGWVNNREADDLRRYRAHYDVTVMIGIKAPEDLCPVSAGTTTQRDRATMDQCETLEVWQYVSSCSVRTSLVPPWHYSDVIMDAMPSQITSLTIVYSIVYSGADQREHQSSASLAFVQGIHR